MKPVTPAMLSVTRWWRRNAVGQLKSPPYTEQTAGYKTGYKSRGNSYRPS